MENDGISFDDHNAKKRISFARSYKDPTPSILVVASRGNAAADALFLR
jgi:hypothetical protein